LGRKKGEPYLHFWRMGKGKRIENPRREVGFVKVSLTWKSYTFVLGFKDEIGGQTSH